MSEWGAEDSDPGQDVDHFLGQALDFFEGHTKLDHQPLSSDKEWLATRLGIPSGSMKWVKGSIDVIPGEYAKVEKQGVVLYIHLSREHAYLEKCPKVDNHDLRVLIQKLFQIKPIEEIEPRSHAWTLVSTSYIKSAETKRLHAFELDKLSRAADEIEHIKQVAPKQSERLEQFEWSFLNVGDLVYESGDQPPGLCDVFGKVLERIEHKRSHPLGYGLKKVDDGLWEITVTGYLMLKDEALEMMPPIVIDTDQYWAQFIISSGMKKLSSTVWDTLLSENNVVKGLLGNARDEANRSIIELKKGVQLVEIAKAIVAEDGEDAKLIWKIDSLDAPGEVQDDGTIDFRAGKKVYTVQRGEILAEKVLAKPGKPGFTVTGDKVNHKIGKDIKFEAGKNVKIEEHRNKIVFVSEVEGVPKQEGNRVAVIEALFLAEGVNFNTGNIEYHGDVIVDGSIQNGFSVRAGGDITVYDSIENGANVVCRGDLIVGKGIIGLKTKIVAKGNVKARFVQDSTLMGGKDLTITDHIYHGKVRCEGKVIVERCSKSNRSGSIVGGYVWGMSGVEVHFLGTQAEVSTNVGVGIDEIRLEADQALQKQLDDMHQQVLFLLQSLGLKSLDASAMKKMVQEDPKSEPRVKRLMEVVGDYQKRLQFSKAQEEKKKTQEKKSAVYIEIHNRIYSNVCLYHGSQRKLLKKTSFEKKWRIIDKVLVGK